MGVILSDVFLQYQEAEEAYRKAIDLDSGYVDAWNNLGNALYGQKRYQESESAYLKAIELDAQFGIAWRNLCYSI